MAMPLHTSHIFLSKYRLAIHSSSITFESVTRGNLKRKKRGSNKKYLKVCKYRVDEFKYFFKYTLYTQNHKLGFSGKQNSACVA